MEHGIICTPIQQEDDGWYFTELQAESRKTTHGPYETQEQAQQEFRRYCETSLLENSE